MDYIKDLTIRLPEEEMQRISTMRDFYASTHANGWASNDYILREWNNAKLDLYRFFGNQFVISKQVHIEEDPEVLLKKLLRSEEYNTFADRFIKATEGVMVAEIADGWVKRDFFYGLIEGLDIVKNKYSGQTRTLVFPDIKEGEKGFKVHNGMKMMRILSAISKHTHIDNQIFEDFRLKCSQITNEKMIDRMLYVSILPSDFMTASVNDCDWCSCMTWEEGDYRQGTVEMMNSPLVVCAYTTASWDMILDGTHFNNKNWREFFLVDPAYIIGIKGYPYWNRSLENEVLNLIAETIEKNTEYTYNRNVIELNTRNGFSIENPETENFFEFNFYTNKMYNDFYSQHNMLINSEEIEKKPARIDVNYSGCAECMHCGNLDGDYIGENELLCDDCVGNIAYCTQCGCRINLDTDSYFETLDGDFYCDYCASELPYCDCCDERYPDRNIYDYNIKDKSTGQIICRCVPLCDSCVISLSKYFKVHDYVITIDFSKVPDSYRECHEEYGYTIGDFLWRKKRMIPHASLLF